MVKYMVKYANSCGDQWGQARTQVELEGMINARTPWLYLHLLNKNLVGGLNPSEKYESQVRWLETQC